MTNLSLYKQTTVFWTSHWSCPQPDSRDSGKTFVSAERSLTKAEQNYSPPEGEALAAVWGINTFRPYIHGTRFTLETDCSAIAWFKKQTEPSPKLTRWLIVLPEQDFELKHRTGNKNANADALSRLPAPSGDPDVMHRSMAPIESLICEENCQKIMNY